MGALTLLNPPSAAQVQLAQSAIAANIDPKFRCSMQAPAVPDAPWLVDCLNEANPRHDIFVAMDGATPYGLLVFHIPSLRVVWLCFNARSGGHTYTEVTSFFGAAIKLKYGVVPTGRIENADARNALLANDPAFRQINTDQMFWGT